MAKTRAFKASETPEAWHLIDASGQVLGRMATQAAVLLRGKHKPVFTPNENVGDSVVVINAEKVVLTGKKWTQKEYHRHSGFIGGLKTVSADALRREHPDRIVTWAITGMLPKTKLGRAMAKKLRVYAGPTHPHAAQLSKPVPSTPVEPPSAPIQGEV